MVMLWFAGEYPHIRINSCAPGYRVCLSSDFEQYPMQMLTTVAGNSDEQHGCGGSVDHAWEAGRWCFECGEVVAAWEGWRDRDVYYEEG